MSRARHHGRKRPNVHWAGLDVAFEHETELGPERACSLKYRRAPGLAFRAHLNYVFWNAENLPADRFWNEGWSVWPVLLYRFEREMEWRSQFGNSSDGELYAARSRAGELLQETYYDLNDRSEPLEVTIGGLQDLLDETFAGLTRRWKKALPKPCGPP